MAALQPLRTEAGRGSNGGADLCQQLADRAVEVLQAFAAGQEQHSLAQQCRAVHCMLACISSAAGGLQTHIPHGPLVTAIRRGLEWRRRQQEGKLYWLFLLLLLRQSKPLRLVLWHPFVACRAGAAVALVWDSGRQRGGRG